MSGTRHACDERRGEECPSALKSQCCLSSAESTPLPGKAKSHLSLGTRYVLPYKVISRTRRSGSWVQDCVSHTHTTSKRPGWHCDGLTAVSQHVTWMLCDNTAVPPRVLAASLAYCLLRTIRIKFHTRKARTLEQGPVSADIWKT